MHAASSPNDILCHLFVVCCDAASINNLKKKQSVVTQCMSAMEILKTYHIHHYRRHNDENHAVAGNDAADIPDFISREDFLAICPSIIYQLDERICQPDRSDQRKSATLPLPCRGDADGSRRKCTEVDDGSSSSSSDGGQDVNTTASAELDVEPLMVFGVPAKS
jgi:hypothetical protein